MPTSAPHKEGYIHASKLAKNLDPSNSAVARIWINSYREKLPSSETYFEDVIIGKRKLVYVSEEIVDDVTKNYAKKPSRARRKKPYLGKVPNVRRVANALKPAIEKKFYRRLDKKLKSFEIRLYKNLDELGEKSEKILSKKLSTYEKTQRSIGYERQRYTVNELAGEVGFSYQYILSLIKSGKIKAKKEGLTYYIEKRDGLNFKREIGERKLKEGLEKLEKNLYNDIKKVVAQNIKEREAKIKKPGRGKIAVKVNYNKIVSAVKREIRPVIGEYKTKTMKLENKIDKISNQYDKLKETIKQQIAGLKKSKGRRSLSEREYTSIVSAVKKAIVPVIKNRDKDHKSEIRALEKGIKGIQKEFDEYRAEQSGKGQVYTIGGFAEEVGLSYVQVLKRIENGEIKAERVGKKYQIPREEKFKYRRNLEEERLKELSGMYQELANSRKEIERLNNRFEKYGDLKARLPGNIVTKKELNKYLKGYKTLIKENIQNEFLNLRDEFSKATGEVMLEEYNKFQFPTVKEAARELSLEPKELHRMLRIGLITPFHIGKRVHLTRKQVDVIKLLGPETGVYEGMEMIEKINREMAEMTMKYNSMEAGKGRMEEKFGILTNKFNQLKGMMSDLGKGKGDTSPEEKAALILPEGREYFEGSIEDLRGNLYQWAANKLDFVLQMVGEDGGKEIEDSLFFMAGPPNLIDDFCERLKGLANAYKILHNWDEARVKDLTRVYSKLPNLGKGAYKPLDRLADINENNVAQNEEFTIGMIEEWDKELAEMNPE